MKFRLPPQICSNGIGELGISVVPPPIRRERRFWSGSPGLAVARGKLPITNLIASLLRRNRFQIAEPSKMGTTALMLARKGIKNETGICTLKNPPHNFCLFARRNRKLLSVFGANGELRSAGVAYITGLAARVGVRVEVGRVGSRSVASTARRCNRRRRVDVVLPVRDLILTVQQVRGTDCSWLS